MWGHQHVWVEHARTVTSPTMQDISGSTEYVERMLSGVTTFIFRCREERCGALKKIEALGHVPSES